MATVLSRLDHHAKTRPDAVAYGRKVGNTWRTTGWRAYRDQVKDVGRALIALGFEPGDTVGVLGFNRPEWTMSALGAMTAGGAAAGVYTTNAPEQVGYVLRHSGAKVAVVDTEAQLEKVAAVRDTLPELRHVVLVEGEPRGEGVLGWQEFVDGGARVLGSALDERLQGLRPEQLATLIYTSGTTGVPKAVMLSHSNVLETVKMIVHPFDLNPQDIAVSYLPLAHIAEQMLTIHMPTYVGCAIYYAEPSPEKVALNLREVRPTIFFGVPRVWERFANGIEARLEEATGAKRQLVQWALEVTRKAVGAELRGERPSPGLALQRRLAEKLVTSKARAAIGFDRVRMGASGAAPVAAEILEFMSGLGVKVYEVWGLSETGGPATWNRPGKTKLGTVGLPLDEVEVRLADDGEVLVRGPNVFMGYLDDPGGTAEAFAEGGWFHTGDVGAFDDDGYLSITGRKKNILITSGGKNIAPEGIETALKQVDLVADAVVVGEGQRFVAALLTLDADAVARFIEGRELAGPPHEDPDVRAAVRAGVEEVNRNLSRVEAVREFRILPRTLSQEEGELTPTLKVRRQAVMERWADVIAEIYAG